MVYCLDIIIHDEGVVSNPSRCEGKIAGRHLRVMRPGFVSAPLECLKFRAEIFATRGKRGVGGSLKTPLL